MDQEKKDIYNKYTNLYCEKIEVNTLFSMIKSLKNIYKILKIIIQK